MSTSKRFLEKIKKNFQFF